MFFVNVGVSSTELLGPSERRVAVAFFGTMAGRVTITNDATAVLDNGPTLVQSQAPAIFDVNVLGDCVTRPWNGIAAVAGPIGIIEVVEG